MGKISKAYTADFETTANPDDCRVWAWAICNIEDFNEVYYGTDITSFMQKIKELSNCSLYFHNLRFDSQFIIWHLLDAGYKHVDSKHMKELTFSTLINGTNQIYEMDIVFSRKWSKGRAYYKRVRIYDSLKKLPFPVKKIAKDFKLPIQKLNMDYLAPRERGHRFTPDEQDYLKNDVEIMARALAVQFGQGLGKMTIGADAMASYKRSIGEEQFRKWFPVLDYELDRELRKAYHGGWTYVNPKFQNMDIGHGRVYDVNSLYPSVMRQCIYPVGMPCHFMGKYEPDAFHPLYIQKFICQFKLKEGRLPCVQIKKSMLYNDTEYLTESVGDTMLTMCNVDMELFFEQYDVYDIEYIEYWSFKAKEDIFANYIDSWYKVKETSSGAIRQIAKLMLNNLYGKFATSPEIIEKVPVMEDGKVMYVVDSMYHRPAVYIPVGIFCTAYARSKTIRTAQSVYDRFIYADTDSVHLAGDEEPAEMAGTIDDKAIGLWKNESNFTRGRFLKAKSYIEEEEISREEMEEKQKSSALYYERDGKCYHLNVKCAGMNDAIKEKVTFDNFHVGFTSSGKLVPRNVRGGVILQDTEFTIKDFKKVV